MAVASNYQAIPDASAAAAEVMENGGGDIVGGEIMVPHAPDEEPQNFLLLDIMDISLISIGIDIQNRLHRTWSDYRVHHL